MSERGSTLVFATMLLFTGIIVLGGLFGLSAGDYRAALAAVETNKVRYIAEAGIAKAIARLNEDADWREGFHAVSFGEGNLTVTLEGKEEPANDQTTTEAPATVIIKSDAFIPPRARHSMQAVYDLREKKVVSLTE